MKLSLSFSFCIALLACTGVAFAMKERIISPDGRFEAIISKAKTFLSDTTIVVFSLSKDGRRQLFGPIKCARAQFSPNSQFIGIDQSRTFTNASIILFSTETGRIIWQISADVMGNFSEDSKLLSVYQTVENRYGDDHTSLVSYSTETGELISISRDEDAKI